MKHPLNDSANPLHRPVESKEHSNSQNLDLADWPVWGTLIDRSGHHSAFRLLQNLKSRTALNPELDGPSS